VLANSAFAIFIAMSNGNGAYLQIRLGHIVVPCFLLVQSFIVISPSYPVRCLVVAVAFGIALNGYWRET